MNALIDPRPVDGDIHDALHRAKLLIERQDFEPAAALYAQLLDTDLAIPLRAEIQTNLAAALCMLARATPAAEPALALLDRAHALLIEALRHRDPSIEPDGWVSTRANLAVVHLARYQATGERSDILSAHLALDGVEAALTGTTDPTLLDWVTAIRDHLVDLRDRRGKTDRRRR